MACNILEMVWIDFFLSTILDGLSCIFDQTWCASHQCIQLSSIPQHLQLHINHNQYNLFVYVFLTFSQGACFAIRINLRQLNFLWHTWFFKQAVQNVCFICVGLYRGDPMILTCVVYLCTFARNVCKFCVWYPLLFYCIELWCECCILKAFYVWKLSGQRCVNVIDNVWFYAFLISDNLFVSLCESSYPWCVLW